MDTGLVAFTVFIVDFYQVALIYHHEINYK